MADTIVEYLGGQRASFADVPVGDVDSLVFSTISYFSFERGTLGRVVPAKRVPLPVAICGVSHDELYGGIWLARMGGDAFLEALLASPRFMDLEVGFYADETSSHFEKQFAAITFFLPEDDAFVAFRGTDNTLAGWKEDFNLTFMSEVPSQVRARTYLEDIVGNGARRVYVGGHSKGGNLAEYAALTCQEPTFEKVERIFNHDGPGFAFSPGARIASDEYRRKLRKTVPESSVFGMLMEGRDCYRVVKSSGVLFAQHAPTHWAVDGGDFVTLEKIGPEAALLSGTLNGWAKSYPPDKRELFIDAAFDIFSAANADTWSEFADGRAASAFAVAEAVAKLPSDMRAELVDMVRDIAPILGTEAADLVRDRFSG